MLVNRSENGRAIMKQVVDGKDRKNNKYNNNNYLKSSLVVKYANIGIPKSNNKHVNHKNNNISSTVKRSVILPLGDYLSNLDAMISKEDAKLASGLTLPQPMNGGGHQLTKIKNVIAMATEKRGFNGGNQHEEDDNDDDIWSEVSWYCVDMIFLFVYRKQSREKRILLAQHF